MTLFPQSPQDLLGIMKWRELHCELFLFSAHVRVMKTWMRPSWLWGHRGCLGHCATNGLHTGEVVKNKQKTVWTREKYRLKQRQCSVKAKRMYVQRVMAFKTQRNSHQMPCSSTSFMVPVLLSTPNTLTSLHEWTYVTCLSPWENSFRPTGSSLRRSPERHRDLRAAQSPTQRQTPRLGEDAHSVKQQSSH